MQARISNEFQYLAFVVRSFMHKERLCKILWLIYASRKETKNNFSKAPHQKLQVQMHSNKIIRSCIVIEHDTFFQWHIGLFSLHNRTQIKMFIHSFFFFFFFLKERVKGVEQRHWERKHEDLRTVEFWHSCIYPEQGDNVFGCKSLH